MRVGKSKGGERGASVKAGRAQQRRRAASTHGRGCNARKLRRRWLRPSSESV